MAISATSLYSSLTDSTDYQAQIDALVSQYKITQSKPVVTLTAKKTSLTNLQQIYSSLKTKITTLKSLSENFAKTDSTSKFSSNSVSVSNSIALSATANGNAVPGTYSVFVSQLAKADKVISSKLHKETVAISKDESAEFKVTVGSNSYDLSIDLTKDDTNQMVLQKIVNAVNSSAAKSKISATIISDNSNYGRIVLTSKKTGSLSAISLSDTSNDILSKIGLTGKNNSSDSSSRTAYSSDTGGHITENIDNLDSVINVDNIEIIRNSNTINDAIPGVTLELKSPQKSDEEASNLTISLDKETVKSNVVSFITAYNDVLTLLNQKLSSIDGNRSELAGDSVFMSLKQNLRDIFSSKVDTVLSDNPNFLADIGIITNRDGTLSLNDSTTFMDTLESDVSKISDLFNSTNGIAVKLNDLLAPLVTSNGIFTTRSSSTSSQITEVDKRIKSLQAGIDKKAEAVRKKYEDLINVITNLTNQQNLMNSMLSSTGLF